MNHRVVEPEAGTALANERDVFVMFLYYMSSVNKSSFEEMLF